MLAPPCISAMRCLRQPCPRPFACRLTQPCSPLPSLPPPSNLFTIHGLWPSNYAGDHPANCGSEAFDREASYNEQHVQTLAPAACCDTSGTSRPWPPFDYQLVCAAALPTSRPINFASPSPACRRCRWTCGAACPASGATSKRVGAGQTSFFFAFFFPGRAAWAGCVAEECREARRMPSHVPLTRATLVPSRAPARHPRPSSTHTHTRRVRPPPCAQATSRPSGPPSGPSMARARRRCLAAPRSATSMPRWSCTASGTST